MAAEREVSLKFRTAYEGQGAQRAIADVQKLTQATEQASIRQRVLANIEASRKARQSSNIDDKEQNQEARVQRRLEAQRAETSALQAAKKPLEEVAEATSNVTAKKLQLSQALKLLAGDIPGAGTAALALKNQYVAVAAAVVGLTTAFWSLVQAQNRAAQESADLSAQLDPAARALVTHRQRAFEAETAVRDFAEELAKTGTKVGEYKTTLSSLDDAINHNLEMGKQQLELERKLAEAYIAKDQAAGKITAAEAAERRAALVENQIEGARALDEAAQQKRFDLLGVAREKALAQAKGADAGLPGARTAVTAAKDAKERGENEARVAELVRENQKKKALEELAEAEKLMGGGSFYTTAEERALGRSRGRPLTREEILGRRKTGATTTLQQIADQEDAAKAAAAKRNADYEAAQREVKRLEDEKKEGDDTARQSLLERGKISGHLMRERGFGARNREIREEMRNVERDTENEKFLRDYEKELMDRVQKEIVEPRRSELGGNASAVVGQIASEMRGRDEDWINALGLILDEVLQSRQRLTDVEGRLNRGAQIG